MWKDRRKGRDWPFSWIVSLPWPSRMLQGPARCPSPWPMRLRPRLKKGGCSPSTGDISLFKGDGASGVTVSVPLENGFREVAAGWLQKRSLLVVDVFPQRNGALIQRSEGPTGMRKLRGVRFGPRKDFTRVVLDLDARPTFQVTWTDPKAMVLRLIQTETAFKVGHIGTVKRLKGSSLTREGNDLSLRLRCESTPLAWRVFWLDVGNRLVVDLFERIQGTSFESVDLSTDFGHERIKATDPPNRRPLLGQLPSGEPPDQAPQSAEHPSTLPSEVPKEDKPPPPANPPRRTVSGVRFVRLPIAREEKPFADGPTIEGPSPADRLGGPLRRGRGGPWPSWW